MSDKVIKGLKMSKKSQLSLHKPNRNTAMVLNTTIREGIMENKMVALLEYQLC